MTDDFDTNCETSASAFHMTVLLVGGVAVGAFLALVGYVVYRVVS